MDKFNDSFLKEYGKNLKAVWMLKDDCRMEYCILIDNLQLPPDRKKMDFDIASLKEKAKIDLKIRKYELTDFFNKVTSNDLGLCKEIINASVIYDPDDFFMPLKKMLEDGLILGTQESVMKIFDSAKNRFKNIESLKKQILHNTYKAVLDSAAAAFSARNYSMPVSSEIPSALKKYFVKQHILESVYASIAETVINKYKSFEHGNLRNISGKELGELHNAAYAFVERMNTLVGEGFSGSDAEI